MGPGGRRPAGERLTLPLVAQVVPAVPAFAVDDGFSYEVPGDLAADVTVGSVVRVPLGGRRVRGYVVDVRPRPADGLKEVAAVSGDAPVFDHRLLQTLRWAAVHYVAPLAAVLAKAAPPNVPRNPPPGERVEVPAGGPSPLPEVTTAAAAGRHPRPTALVGPGPWPERVASLAAPVLDGGGSALVVAATLAEAEELRAGLESLLPGLTALGSSGIGARRTTAAWANSQRAGRLLVGTRETAFWRIAALALAVLVEDGRRGMKDKATPTTHVRDVLRRRASVERFGLVVAGAVPTAELIGAGVEVAPLPGRHWPLVEVADRTEEPPGGGFLMERTRLALRGLVNRGGRAVVFTHRRGYAPAFRCSQCRTIRRCPECGARPEPGTSCVRCGAALGGCTECGGRRFEPLGAGQGRILEELRRVIGAAAGDAGSDASVRVVTERDLVGVPPADLAVVVDADGLMLAPHYRAEEDALRLMVRVAQTVVPGRGHRCLVQTSMSAAPVLGALRSGRALEFLDELVAARARDGFPPAGELLVVEVAGAPAAADADLRAAAAGRAEVLGPAAVRERSRWLVQGADLRQVRVGLRRLVGSWREAGARVRIDADPVDL